MGCCGPDEDQQKQGMATDRRCRDVLFLLLFMAYWGGMFVVCRLAFRAGDANRLIYAVDSRGLLCGTNNSFRNSSIDLTGSPNLYYLNALDLLSPTNMLYAKTVCVSSCPGAEDACDIGDLPCTNNSQYRCPYYRLAEQGLWGSMSAGASPADVSYFANLSTATVATCDASLLQAAESVAGLNLSAMGIDINMCSGVLSGSGAGGKYLQATSQFPGRGPCYPVWAPTVPYFNRCFPKFPAAFTGSVYSSLNTSAGVLGSAVSVAKQQWGSGGPAFSSYVADISKGMAIIVIAGLGGGVVLSLAWMLILRYFAGLMVWLTVAVVNAALAGCTVYAYNMAGLLTQAGYWGAAIAAQLPVTEDPTGLSRQNWAYIAYGLSAVMALTLLITLVMIRRVAVAVACVKVASKAVGSMPSILLFPLLPFVLEVGLIIYWVSVTAVLYSAGYPQPHWRPAQPYEPLGIKQLMLSNSSAAAPAPPTTPNTTGMTNDEVLELCASSPDCYVSYDWDDRLKYAFIYHLFGLLWTNQLIVALTSVVVAGAVANFYWARGDSSNQPSFPVLKALRNTLIYSLGSLALGSFVIAIIQFVRILLEYVDKKTRHLQQQNKVAAWAMCIVRGLMWLLEKVVAFINRNAFILVAVKGSSYCTSAARAVQLIVANALRLTAVNILGDAVLFLGKLGVAACCGVGAFALTNLEFFNSAEKYPATYLSSGILPIAVAVLTGYIVAQIFFSVYEMAIDTMLLCLCEDCESNGGHPRYAPKLLLEAIGESAPPADHEKPQQRWT